MATLLKPLLLSSSSRLRTPTCPPLSPRTYTPSRKKTNHQKMCCVLETFLDLKPDSKPELLDIDLSCHESPSHSHYDVIIVGVGLAGLSLAESLSSYGMKVCCIDPSPLSVFPKNYGVWVDEFEKMGLGDCLGKKWTTSMIYLDDHRRKCINHPYGRVDNKALKERLMKGCVLHGVKFHMAEARGIVHHELDSSVMCDDGSKIVGSLVVDASDCTSTFVEYDKPRDHSYQLGHGILAEVEEHLFDLDKMVLMDWRDSHLGSKTYIHGSNNKVPTFFSAMPLEKNLIFLEETFVTSNPLLSYMDVKRRMEFRLRNLGINVKRVIEDKKLLIPVGGPLPCIPQSVMAIGGTTALVQPSSGYMVTHVMTLSRVLANVIAECIGSTKMIRGNELYGRVWNGLWTSERMSSREFFNFGMETMLNMDLMETRDFLDAFYDMDPCYWKGFLSSTLTVKELPLVCLTLFRGFSSSSRFSILSKSPLPFVKMICNIAY